MDWTNLLAEAGSLVAGGGLGAVLTQLYTAKEQKKKLAAEEKARSLDNSQKELDLRQDAFDTMYGQLNRCMADYHKMADDFKAFREQARIKEEELMERINVKCDELATLKSKVNYLKGIRCYDTLCTKRVKTNPDRVSVKK